MLEIKGSLRRKTLPKTQSQGKKSAKPQFLSVAKGQWIAVCDYNHMSRTMPENLDWVGLAKVLEAGFTYYGIHKH